MMENLTELIKTNTPETLVEKSLEQEKKRRGRPAKTANASTQEQSVEQKDQQPQTSANIVNVINLTEWFNQFSETTDVKPVKIAIRGVPTNNILILSFPTGNILPDGTEEKDVELFKRAQSIPALQRPAKVLNIYNSSYRMVHEIDDIIIKSYGLRKNIILTLCVRVQDLILPLSIIKVKKRDKNISLPVIDKKVVDTLSETLNKPVDHEALEIRYVQSKGQKFQNIREAVKWLQERQEQIKDINHHLQIDNIVISMLT